MSDDRDDSGSVPRATIGERLREADRRCFVGRAGEIELVRAALEAGTPPFAVLYLHGPGGVGKSALLSGFAATAASAGVPAVPVDVRAIDPTPAAFLARVAAGLGRPGADLTLEGLAGCGRVLVLVDTFERAAPLQAWLRDRFVPALADGAVVVVAGRAPPPAEWVADAAWRDLMRVVSLRNLAPADARRYLDLRGVDQGMQARLVELTHGHPLALSLVVDVLDQRGDPGGFDLVDAPDLVRTLMERFVEEIPGQRHREALAVCAHARFTTEDLLRAAMGGDDIGLLLDWLRSRSFIEEGRDGVFPHDLARDVLDTDLRWRDRVAYADLHRRVRADVVARIRGSEGRDQQRALADLIYLHRLNPVMRPLYDWAQLGHAYADALGQGDGPLLVAMAERAQGPEQAALVEHWLVRQPGAFTVFRRSDDDVAGFTALLRLDEAAPDDLAADPGAGAMWAYATRHDPPRPGEAVTATRFFVDEDADQRPSSPSWTAFSITHARHVLSGPSLAWDFIGPFRTPEVEPVFNYIDYHRVPDAEFAIGGHLHVVFAHDWRRTGPEAWIELMGRRELDDSSGRSLAPSAPAPVLVLSHAEFVDAVRAALRNRHRPDRLDGNPLARSRIVRERLAAGARSPADALAGLLDEAADALTVDPRDAKGQRAVDRTYLRPAPTQERAAEVLGLPFSTYRRHLARGVERIVEHLWDLEVYGRR